MPSEARLELAQIGILAIHDDLAYGTAVLVGLIPINSDGFSKDQITEMLLRVIAECLGFFRGVDAGQANLVLHFATVQHGNRIAVTDSDNLSLEGFAVQRAGPR